MSRLTPLDRVLVLILVPIWVACFALSIRSQVRGDGRPAIGVSAPADTESYPTATGRVYPLARPSFEASGLRRGDRLIRMGGVDLRGVGPFRFAVLSSEQAAGGHRVPLVIERGAERSETFLPMSPLSAFRGQLAGSLLCLVAGVILLLRAPHDPVIRAFHYTVIAAAFCTLYFGGDRPAYYLCTATFVGGPVLFFPLIIRWCQRFQHGLLTPAAVQCT